MVFCSFLARKPIRLLVRAYVDVMRGTPVLVLILAAFYMPSVIGLSMTATQAGVVALTLFAGAHIGELVRGALQSLPPGQTRSSQEHWAAVRANSAVCFIAAGDESGSAALDQYRS